MPTQSQSFASAWPALRPKSTPQAQKEDLSLRNWKPTATSEVQQTGTVPSLVYSSHLGDLPHFMGMCTRTWKIGSSTMTVSPANMGGWWINDRTTCTSHLKVSRDTGSRITSPFWRHGMRTKMNWSGPSPTTTDGNRPWYEQGSNESVTSFFGHK